MLFDKLFQIFRFSVWLFGSTLNGSHIADKGALTEVGHVNEDWTGFVHIKEPLGTRCACRLGEEVIHQPRTEHRRTPARRYGLHIPLWHISILDFHARNQSALKASHGIDTPHQR